MQIKLYIFESVHDARAFSSAEETTPGHDAAPSTVQDSPKAKPEKGAYVKKTYYGPQKPSCSKCGNRGHNIKTCPLTAKDDDESDEPSQALSKLSTEQLRAAVQGLKEDGLDSFRIAQRLKVTLKTVNENW